MSALRSSTNTVDAVEENLQLTIRLLAALSVFALGAHAGVITSVTTRAGLGANDLLQWGTVDDDAATFPASPYTRASTGGLDVTADLTTGFAIFVQNGAAFTGNFAPGDILLDSYFADGPISITFATPVRGVGFNIQHLVTGAFTGQLDFYGTGNTLFGSVSRNGVSNMESDGSAIFLGGRSSLRDITRIDVGVNSVGGSTGLSINQMSLLTTNPPTGAVPEPSTLVLVSAGLAGCFWIRRRR